jgi:hypothetical protein
MYFLTMSAERWPVWDMITRAEAPAAAALVASPALNECPAYPRRIEPDRLRPTLDDQRDGLVRQPRRLHALKPIEWSKDCPL